MTEHETEPETISVGAILKNGREERNISIADVAHQLHLDSRIIRALEEDDYDYLPDPIYVRGYIRNYCKLLEIEADVILDQFMKSSGGKDPEIIPEIKHHSQTSSSDKPVKAFTYLISLALVILLIAWWQSNFIISNDSTPDPQVTTDDNEVTPPPMGEEAAPPGPVEDFPEEPRFIEDIETVEDATLEIDAEITATEEPIQEEADNVEQVMESNDEPAFLQADEELSFDEEEVSGDISTNTPSPAFSETNASEGTSPEPQTVDFVPSTGPDTLVLTVNSDSWIEIYDVNSQRVYFDLGRRGDRLTLYGTAPFEILLGFAQGVSIEFNGDPIEQAPFTRSGVARFTLGE